MSTMAISYPHSDPIVTGFEKFAGRVLFRFAHTINVLPWVIGLILLLTLGLLYTLIVYLPLRFARRSSAKQLRSIIVNLKDYDERNLMEMHAEMENDIVKVESLINSVKQLFIFRPILNELLKLHRDLVGTERQLFKVVYPDYSRVFSKDEVERFTEQLKPWGEHTESVSLVEHG